MAAKICVFSVDQIECVRHDSDDEIKFYSGRVARSGDVAKRAAGEQLLALAHQEVKRKGCSLSDALRVTFRGSPDLVRKYLA